MSFFFLDEYEDMEAYIPGEPFPDFELHRREQGHGVVKPVQLLLAEIAFGNPGFEEFEELSVTKIFLKVSHRVVGYGEYFRSVKPGSAELPVNGEKSPVLCLVGTFAGDEGSAFAADTEILSGAAGEGKEFLFLRFAACEAAV